MDASNQLKATSISLALLFLNGIAPFHIFAAISQAPGQALTTASYPNRGGCAADTANRATICKQFEETSTMASGTIEQQQQGGVGGRLLKCPQPADDDDAEDEDSNVLLICSAIYGRWDERPCSTSKNTLDEIEQFISERGPRVRLLVTPEVILQCDNKAECNISFDSLVCTGDCLSVKSLYVEVAYICLPANSYPDTRRIINAERAKLESATPRLAQQRGVNSASLPQTLLTAVTSIENSTVSTQLTSAFLTTIKRSSFRFLKTLAVSSTSTATSTAATRTSYSSSIATILPIWEAITVERIHQEERQLMQANNMTIKANETYQQTNDASYVVMAGSIGGSIGFLLFGLAALITILLFQRKKYRRRAKMLASVAESIRINASRREANSNCPKSNSFTPGRFVTAHLAVTDNRNGSLPIRCENQCQQQAQKSINNQEQQNYATSNRFYTLSQKKFDSVIPFKRNMAQTMVERNKQCSFKAEIIGKLRHGSQSSGTYCDIGDLEQVSYNNLPCSNNTQLATMMTEDGRADYANSPSNVGLSSDVSDITNTAVAMMDDASSSTCATCADDDCGGHIGNTWTHDRCYETNPNSSKNTFTGTNNGFYYGLGGILTPSSSEVPAARLSSPHLFVMTNETSVSSGSHYANGAVVLLSSTNDSKMGNKNEHTNDNIEQCNHIPNITNDKPVVPYLIFHQRNDWQFLGDER